MVGFVVEGEILAQRSHSYDFSSSRLVFALIGAVAARQAVDMKLLLLELSLGSVALALWRCLCTTTNPDTR